MRIECKLIAEPSERAVTIHLADLGMSEKEWFALEYDERTAKLQEWMDNRLTKINWTVSEFKETRPW